ncbi:helix-turn-helix domain-containing protein [Cryptosporangium sp. NPDC051539]|uniref:helix-turn-helix domain-containing protein n=1 Tax=Cryptosporangium sp. NPDC051539 TaxID=3363962 RepID=UPI0037AE7427
MTDATPAVMRRRLRIQLRRMRENLDLTQRAAADAMDWSLSKLIRIEAGMVNISTNDLRALLGYYGVDDVPEVDDKVEVARVARTKSLWSPYRDIVSSDYVDYLEYESSAKTVRVFQNTYVPGLLQTEEYAQEVLKVATDNDLNRVGQLWELRRMRQDRLLRDNGPTLQFVLDEAVIRRSAAGPEKMARQLEHLLAVNTRPNVTIRIVPFTEGIYPLMEAPYYHLEFNHPDDPSISFEERPSGDLVQREDDTDSGEGPPPVGTPQHYLGNFYYLERITRIGDTSAMIRDAIARFRGTAP